MTHRSKWIAVALAACAAGSIFLVREVRIRRAETRRVQREAAYRANNLGVARLERFDFAGAAEAFRQALQADSGLTLARINLSIALLHVPDVEGAEREASAAASILPSAPQPHYVLGLIARMTNREDEALAAFERVRQIDPGDVGTNVNRGQIYLQQQRHDEAMAAFRAAMAEEPYSVTATYNLGLTMTRRGERDEGLALMERSQTLRESGYGTTLTASYGRQRRRSPHPRVGVHGSLGRHGADELVDGDQPGARHRKHRVCRGRQSGRQSAPLPTLFMAGRQPDRRFRWPPPRGSVTRPRRADRGGAGRCVCAPP